MPTAPASSRRLTVPRSSSGMRTSVGSPTARPCRTSARASASESCECSKSTTANWYPAALTMSMTSVDDSFTKNPRARMRIEIVVEIPRGSHVIHERTGRDVHALVKLGALLACRARARRRIDHQFVDPVLIRQADGHVHIGEELLQFFVRDQRGVLDRRNFAMRLLVRDPFRRRTDVIESMLPVVLERRDGGDRDAAMFVERERDFLARVGARHCQQRHCESAESSHHSSRIAAIGSSRDATRAGYHVATIDRTMAITFTPMTSIGSIRNGSVRRKYAPLGSGMRW